MSQKTTLDGVRQTPASSRKRRTLGMTRIRRSPRLLLLQSQNTTSAAACSNAYNPSSTKLIDISRTFFGLPLSVRTLFEQHRRIANLYPWQKECLMEKALENGRNLILSLPTGGGKTLIAEILMLKQALLRKKDSLLILPFVAIVQEKIRSLSVFGEKLGICIDEYASNKGRLPPIRRRARPSIFVATIEKAHSLINSLIEEGRLGQLGLVVVDELHMLGESRRGPIMEQTLAKIRHFANKGECQIVGMSATLSNIMQLRSFLDAELYKSDFRPVKLIEHVKIGRELYRVQSSGALSFDRSLLPSVRCISFVNKQNNAFPTEDKDNLVGLLSEVLPDHSCLIFCSTKKSAENVARLVARLLGNKPTEMGRSLLSVLEQEGDGRLCPILTQTVPFGVAYHHSGLTVDERRLLQDAYLQGLISVLCCTSTLAAGVNLPAKRVIIRNPLLGNQPLHLAQYQQMVGRAGRAGLDTVGESITIVQPGKQQEQFCGMLRQPLTQCLSRLDEDGAVGFRSLILSLISLRLVTTPPEVNVFISKTLFGIQQDSDRVAVLISDALQFLTTNRLIEQYNGTLKPTDLGRASHLGAVDPVLTPRLYTDLRNSLNTGLVLSSYVNLIFCIVPYDVVREIRPNWATFHREYCSLDADERRVFSILDVQEGRLIQQMSRSVSCDSSESTLLTRLYLTMMLNRLWRQDRIWDVAQRFDVTRGWLQTFLHNSVSFASSVARFCQPLSDLWAYSLLLPDFVQQFAYCVQAGLIPLLAIQDVRKGRARQLYQAGYRTIGSVASCNVNRLVRDIEYLSAKQAFAIITSAKTLLKGELADRMDQITEECGASDLIIKDVLTKMP